MPRHIIDKSCVLDASRRLTEFLRIDRQKGLHPAIRALHVRVRETVSQDARLSQFLRIARGRTA